jgi:sigma-B regulation protein RsbU (phosphoserine phosphatase)
MDGVRVCLLDVGAEFSALHWAFFDEVGVGAARFLYLAGLRAAVAVSAQLPKSDSDVGFLQEGLRLLVQRGYGCFELGRVDRERQVVHVLAQNAVEAWAYLRRQNRSLSPVCNYARGFLAGLWCMAVEPSGEPSPNVACWELQCAAAGAPRCAFVLGSADSLAALGVSNPAEQPSPRWELEALNAQLRVSTSRLREVESRLDERQQAYQHLLDNMLDPLLVVDHRRRIAFCNRRFLDAAGLTEAEAVGLDPLVLIHPDDRNAVGAVLEEMLAGRRRSATFTFRVERGQRSFILESSARAIEGVDGRPAVEAICRDVTEREVDRLALEQANQRLVAKQRIADYDLRLAKLVHESLLPERLSHEAVEVDVKYVPVDRVGGDYCDVALIDGRIALLTLCDVSGHGVAAALLASRVNSHLREKFLHNPDPWAITLDMNEFLRRNFGETGLFVTFLAVTIDLCSFEARICGAGHPGPILVRARDGSVRSFRSQHLPIGILDDFARTPRFETVQLEPGDRLALYTDGIIEAVDENGELLRTAGFEKLLQSARDVPIASLGDWLLAKVAGFRSGKPRDDITLMLVELKRPIPARAEESLGAL